MKTAIAVLFLVQNIGFFLDVKLGSPSTTQSIALDLGSGPLWFSVDPTADGKPCQSDSFMNLSATFDPYIGKRTGYFASDNLVIGDLNLPGTPFGVISDPNRDSHHGCMGFSPSHNKVVDHPEVLGSMPWSWFLAHFLDQPLAGLHFTKDEPGVMTLGYLDPAHYTGRLNSIDVDVSASSWTFNNANFHTPTYSSGAMSMRLDSAGNGIAAPIDVVRAYIENDHAITNSSGTYIFPCDHTPPDWQISVGIGDNIATIKGSALVNPKDKTSDGQCQLLLGIGAEGGFLGVPFFLSNYVGLDFTVGETKLLFAPQSTT